MAEKKITIRVDETIYEAFKALCEANGFRLTILLWTPLVNLMPLSSLQLPGEMMLKEQKSSNCTAKNELGLTDTDLRKLLKYSEQSVPSNSKATEVIESHQNKCLQLDIISDELEALKGFKRICTPADLCLVFFFILLKLLSIYYKITAHIFF